jgi:hypothetical protein
LVGLEVCTMLECRLTLLGNNDEREREMKRKLLVDE